MYTAAVANYFTWFYALGNTPAIELTRTLPHGEDADVLLLGCGDIRNILYTAYCQKGLPRRRLDFTCCDSNSAILARNAFFFSLVVDGGGPVDSAAAWSVYYDLFLDKPTSLIVQEHLAELIKASQSLSTWKQSRYAHLLSFCDEGTLGLIRESWTAMASATDSKTAVEFEKELNRSKDYQKARFRDSVVLTGLRAAAPASVLAMQSGQMPKAYEEYWNQGRLMDSSVHCPNALFSGALSENNVLHYGTDPIPGFHLATAFVKLAPSSAFRMKKSNDEGSLEVIKAAKVQFAEWVAAFRVACKLGLKIRLMVADALVFSHVLATHETTSGSSNTYRRQFDTSTCELDKEAYGPDGIAPRLFDVVDTSNLADHIGLLNLLVAAKPLLKDMPSSTICVEALLQTASTRQEQFNSMLCGEGATIAMLLGLSVIEYWANATDVSSFDEILITTVMTKSGTTQDHTRMSWKLSHHVSGTSKSSTIRVDPKSLAKIVANVYLQMFDRDEILNIHSLLAYDPGQNRGNPYRSYNRGSLAAMIKLMRRVIHTDWSGFYDAFISLITDAVGHLALQELEVQLSLHAISACTSPSAGEQCPPGSETQICSPDHPVALTLVVPRDALRKIHGTNDIRYYAPTLRLVISSADSGDMQSIFLSLHVCFGEIIEHGETSHDSLTISVKEDKLGWRGSSPLIVSCFVSSAILRLKPEDYRISLGVQPVPSTYVALRQAGFGPDLTIFSVSAANPSNVIFTKNMPGMTGPPTIFNHALSTTSPKESLELWFSANFDGDSNKIASITSHTEVTTDQGQKLLADQVPINLQQTSPFSIGIVFGKNQLVLPLCFPLPILKVGSQTRIARKSSYVEVIARVADPLSAEPLSEFMFPVVCTPNAVPVIMNGRYLNIETLPVLDVDNANKKNIQFVAALTSHTFSVREKLIRETGQSGLGMTGNQRLNFKESLFTMFMVSTGLQGGQTGLFLLRHPELGGVIYVIVRSMCLDGAAGSVVLDAAVIALTMDIVTSDKLTDFFLVLRELEVCAITVDDEELRLWRHAIPAFVERSRSWSHSKHCEYARPGATIPLSQKTGEQFLCSCGNGQLPKRYVKLPEWDIACKYAVRAAISPTFSAPFVEDVIDIDQLKASGDMATLTLVEKCRSCGKSESVNGGKLMACSRCKEVFYCSRDCQKVDWKKHRAECK